jgi:hypothetical protein
MGHVAVAGDRPVGDLLSEARGVRDALSFRG